MKKILLSLLLLAGSLIQVNAQSIWNNPLEGLPTPPTSPYTAGDVTATDVTASGITLGTGLTQANGTAGRFQASGWGNANAITQNKSFSFTITPTNGKVLMFGSFVFGFARNLTTSPGNVELRSSLDNYTTAIDGVKDISSSDGTAVGSDPAPKVTFNLNTTSYANITTPITFRLYFYHKTGVTGTGFIAITDFDFKDLTALPVTFTQVSANKLSNSDVQVNWTTASEANNDHFEIEASTDGKTFKTVKAVATKNGNSSTVQEYQESVTLTDIAAVLAFPLVLGLIGFSPASRRRKVAMLMLCVVAVATSFVACQKEGNDMLSQKEQDSKGIINGQKTVYIRIKQVDKNGAFSYSEVVVAK